MEHNKEFDRSIAFTFYAEWAQDAATIEEDYGLEGYALFCKAIINYALYETEVDAVKKPPIKYFWHTIKEKIDASQNHRAKGFTKEDTELSGKIREYKSLNPTASQREIAEVFSCSVGKVNKALKDSTLISTPTTTITSTPTSTSTTVNVNVNAHDSQEEESKKRDLETVLRSLSCKELENMKKMFSNRVSYTEIASEFGITYFDAEKFNSIYDSVHAEQYDREHPEEAAKRVVLEEERKKVEHERLQREMADFEFVSKAFAGRQKTQRRALADIFDEFDKEDVETDNSSEDNCSSLEWLQNNVSNNNSDDDEWEI